VFCRAHTQRKFYDIHAATRPAPGHLTRGSPLAAEALRRIAALYAIEAEIRGKPAEERRQVRQQRSGPLVERVSGRSASAQAIRYALNHWDGLIVDPLRGSTLDDGRLALDTNTVERASRPVTLTRKNALFAGADSGGKRWAIIASLIQTAPLNGVDPLAWLTDVLERVVPGRTRRHELESLLPWNWQAARPAEPHSTA